MKLSLNWIKDYVALPEDMDLKQLAYDLTMSTVEVEDVKKLSENFENLIVGVIQEVLPHPNADKLRICKTDIGGEIKEIVCGGSNLQAGMKVAVACPGAVVRWHGEGEPVVIRNAKLRGVASFGMICASSEIGLADLFPANAETEITDLSAFDVPAGTPLADALDMNDVILEIDNKSMTNRPDLWGHYGIAREISALYNLPLKELPKFNASGIPEMQIVIEDSKRCARYIGAEIENLSVKPSPYQMQNRIWKVGMRPINALVDITNYVMLATGQPTHAFDADQISGNITVRHANPQEELVLLNDKKLALTEDDLVIADSESAVALAGVMGGAKDSVLPSTNRVILEVANFEASGIRRTALRYENRTEASARYEKAIDSERCDQALSMAITLLKEIYPELKMKAFADNYPEKAIQNEIDVPVNWLEHRLGTKFSQEKLVNLLEKLGFSVSFQDNIMHVIVPTWRSTGDISIKDDIMEEVARMYGYENFNGEVITTSFDGAINQLDVDLERKIKEYLAFRCGMQEIFTYPWMTDEYVNAILQNTENMLVISTPPSPNERYIRSSLLPNIVKAVSENLRYYHEFSVFEGARVFFDKNYTSNYDSSELLPEQRKHIGGAFVGDYKKVFDLFRQAKGVLENMARYTHMQALSFKQVQKPVWADETVWLNIFRDDVQVGEFALLSKKSSLACGIKNNAVMLFEIDEELLKPFASRTNEFTHLPEYPMIDYDLSVLVDSSVKWEEIQKIIMSKKKQGSLLQSCAFVEEYKGKQVPDGKKSVTVRLVIGSLEKTLTSSEIESCAESVMKVLTKKMNAELRSK
ncbi:MAG: phenylalanine--tRNA ligase subunit beta [Oscillospiraceae bacterium]|nr:phenylalanine--tRNA ligase subunit beta [Oscillospiraceae bacterium]